MTEAPYLRPTPAQRALLAALVETGTVERAGRRLGLAKYQAENLLREARRRAGMTTWQLIHFGTRDGWLKTPTASSGETASG